MKTLEKDLVNYLNRVYNKAATFAINKTNTRVGYLEPTSVSMRSSRSAAT